MGAGWGGIVKKSREVLKKRAIYCVIMDLVCAIRAIRILYSYSNSFKLVQYAGFLKLGI